MEEYGLSEAVGWYELPERRSVTGRYVLLYHQPTQPDLHGAIHRLDTDCEVDLLNLKGELVSTIASDSPL